MTRFGSLLASVLALGCAPEGLVLEGADAEQEAIVLDALEEFEAASGRVLTPLEIVFLGEEAWREPKFAGIYRFDVVLPRVELKVDLGASDLASITRHELAHHLDALLGWESLSTDELDGLVLGPNLEETLAQLGELGPSDLARAGALASACDVEALARGASWVARHLFPEASEPTVRVSGEAGRGVRIVAAGQRFASATLFGDGSLSVVHYADGQAQSRSYAIETGRPVDGRSHASPARLAGAPTHRRLPPDGERSRFVVETQAEIRGGRRVERVTTVVGRPQHLIRLHGIRLVHGQDETYVEGVGCGPAPADVYVLDDGRVVVLELSSTEVSWWIVGP